MNSVFTAKLLQNLKNKKGEKGFTLIELLVVVIIIGVLAAVALPNLLGQVGKARESEAKNMIGALNRAQQSQFVERGAFATTTAALEVPVGNAKYYQFDIPAAAVQRATGVYDRDADGTVENNNLTDGTRDYVGGVQFDQTTRDFATVVCRSLSDPGFDLSTDADAIAVVANAGSVADASATPMACDTTAGAATETEEVR